MAFLTLLLSGIAYVATTAVYNLVFYPLATTPGPILCRISFLPSFLHACRRDRHVWLWQNFQTYIDKFRAARDLVMFNTPGVFNDIYIARANIIRSRFYRAWKRNERDVTTINSIEPAMHARRRKALNLALAEEFLKAVSPLMVAQVDRWIEILTDGATEAWSQPRDMATYIDELVFDKLGDLRFGEMFSIKELGEKKLKKMPQLIMKHARLGYIASKTSFFDLILFFQPCGLSALQERIRHTDMKAYNAFVESSVDKRVAAHKAGIKGDRQDVFHFLLEAVDPETKLPVYTERDYLLTEARLLVLAGTDISVGTLCALFFTSFATLVY